MPELASHDEGTEIDQLKWWAEDAVAHANLTFDLSLKRQWEQIAASYKVVVDRGGLLTRSKCRATAVTRVILPEIAGVFLLLGTGAMAEVDRPQPNSAVEVLAPMVLNGYSRFPRNIGYAPVYDLEGHRVGLVKRLDADPTGKPAALEIWLSAGRTLTVAASNISYDEQQNIITVELTDAQLGFAPPGPRN